MSELEIKTILLKVMIGVLYIIVGLQVVIAYINRPNMNQINVLDKDTPRAGNKAGEEIR